MAGPTARDGSGSGADRAARHGAAEPPRLPGGAPGRAPRLLDRLVVAAFVVLLPLPAVAMIAGARPPQIENRPLLTPPPLTVEALGDPGWYLALDRAVADNVPFRATAVRLRSRIASSLGATANPAVVRGRDDWLFSREELDPTCRFTAPEVLAALDAIAASFSAVGQEFRVVVAPDKHAVHPEARRADDGFGVPCTDERRAAVAAGMAAPERAAWAIPVWDDLAASRSAAPDGPALYWRQDTHWTPTGALVVIGELVRSLDPALWTATTVVAGDERAVRMDLARQMGVPATELTPEPRVRPEIVLRESELALPVETGNARAVRRFVAEGGLPVLPGRTVVVYDSFFGMQMRRIAPFFAETIWIHQGDLLNHPELAALTGPFDRVILERVERGLYLADLHAQLAPLVRAP